MFSNAKKVYQNKFSNNLFTLSRGVLITNFLNFDCQVISYRGGEDKAVGLNCIEYDIHFKLTEATTRLSWDYPLRTNLQRHLEILHIIMDL